MAELDPTSFGIGLLIAGVLCPFIWEFSKKWAFALVDSWNSEKKKD